MLNPLFANRVPPFPEDLGIIYMIGIGGMGVSGIAETLHRLGYQVVGSDLSESANTQRLRQLGVTVTIGHDAAVLDALPNVAVVVVSSAISSCNVELVHARQRGIPVISRAEMLSELMRFCPSIAVSGTHGKTTTTSLIATTMEFVGLDPTVINGGVINSWGTNSRQGAGQWFVAEADESDGSFLHLPAQIAIVTSIDAEHMDHFQSSANMVDAFRRFMAKVPFYGRVICCVDHPVVRELAQTITERRVITYGIECPAQIRAHNIQYRDDRTVFDVTVRSYEHPDTTQHWEQLELPMLGSHNIANALAVIATCLELGITQEQIREAFAAFPGVQRRFTRLGELQERVIFDDYGHHPVEIAAVLKAARLAKPEGRICAVVQPHRFSRLRDMFAEFAESLLLADSIVIADVYAAGEDPIAGVNKEALAGELIAQGHGDVHTIEMSTVGDAHVLTRAILKHSQRENWVICFGAGSISAIARAAVSHCQSLARQNSA